MTSTNEAPPADAALDAVEADPDAAEAQAAQDAESAAAAAAALEQAVIDGDESVTHDQLAQADSHSRWARLRAENVKRRAEAARVRQRTAACVALRDEIEAAESGAGAEVAALLAAFDKAEAALIEAADKHDAQAVAWRSRAAALGVPESAQPAKAEDGGLVLAPSGSTDLIRTPARIVGVFGGRGLARKFFDFLPAERAALIEQAKRAGGIR